MTRACALETNKLEKQWAAVFQVVRHWRRVRHDPFNPAVLRPPNGVRVSHIKVIYLALLWCEYFNDSSILRFYISVSSTSGGSWGGWRRIRAA